MTRIAAARPIDPEPAANPRAVIGSNRPPIHEIAKSDFDEAIDKHPGLRQRITDLVGSASRAFAHTDAEAALCAQVVRQIAAAQRVVKDEHDIVKRPYLEACRIVDDAAKTLAAGLTAADAEVRGKLTAFARQKQREEDERRRAEEQRRRDEQLAREQEERDRAAAEQREPEPVAAPPPPPPPPAEPVRVRSDFGAVASARKVKVATVDDYAKAFRAVKTVPAVQEAIQKAVNGLVRAGQTNIPGVTITEDVGLSVR